jgi:Abortive infection C-terminus
MARELISPRTRTEFREHFVGYTLREISDEFEAVGIRADTMYIPALSGQRRTLVEQYYHSIDFTKSEDIRKLLEVFENVLIATLNRPPMFGRDPDAARKENSAHVERLAGWLRKDGYDFTSGRLLPVNGSVSLSVLKARVVHFSAEYMAQQIKRMEQAVDTDPDQAIGCAKELIETCCRTILDDRGKAVADRPDVLPLVRRTMQELKLVPEGIPDEAKGAKIIKGVLGNLATLSQGLAELRNIYGTGHGKHGRSKGLSPRHARLAVGAASTLAVFLFDTHKDR